MQMAHIKKVAIALSHIFAWLLLDTFEVSQARESDIHCLKPIKESGEPLKPCHEHIFNFSFKNGFISGFAFSSGLVMTYYVYTEHLKKRENMKIRKGMTKKKFLQEDNTKIPKLERMVTRMSFTEVSEATGNFSTNNVIGLGKIGMMYKAVLPNGWIVAVKRLYDSQQFEEQFMSELLALDRLRHHNLVPLLGFCRERKEKLLVYKYISNGNLNNLLHDREGGAKILEWPLRIKIAIGIARGLAWLHHKCNFQVVHLNLRSNCILLDQDFEPKISNFGGAIISHFGGVVFMNLKDTDSSQSNFVDSGVWELEYVKKDVYDFGIMLLELITGKEPIQMTSSSRSLDGSLVDWITHLLTSSSGLYDAIDKSLTGQGFDGEIFQFLRIACTCIQSFPGERPTMLEVYDKISTVGERYGFTNEEAEICILERMVTRMSFTELGEATGSFSTRNVIGMGKIGMMYKAVQPNGWFLAVKMLHDSEEFEKQFLSELLALGRLQHNNLVPLLGFCRERNAKLLVYKYISNGNLYDWLHTREGGAKILEWPLRIKIATGIARGLLWLHHECNFRVVHLNLSSNCILLDQNFEPKISNFSGAIILNSGGVMFKDLQDSDSSQSIFVDSGVWELEFVKKDVYDFGIMLLELITGKEPIRITSSSKSLDGSLVDWITHLLTGSSGLYDALDKSLTGEGFDGEIYQILRIACTCVQPFPGERPTMLEVYDKICMVGEKYGLTNTISVSDEIVEAEITEID